MGGPFSLPSLGSAANSSQPGAHRKYARAKNWGTVENSSVSDIPTNDSILLQLSVRSAGARIVQTAQHTSRPLIAENENLFLMNTFSCILEPAGRTAVN